MATTQIKRLIQKGTEFVPITLSEAVVVNTDNLALMNGQGITTLDKVLSIALSNVGGVITDINTLEKAVEAINNLLVNKQDKLTAGSGITIVDGVISATLTAELYKIVQELPQASADCMNVIYLVPSSNVINNVTREFICIYVDGYYHWEEIGSIQSDINLEGYVTKQEYDSKMQEIDQSISNITTALGNTISAQNVQVNGHNVVVNYTFTDEQVYGSMLQTDDGDYIQ